MVAYIFYLLVYPLLLLCSIYFGRKIADRSQKKNHQWKPLGLENGLMGFYALLTSFTLVQSGNNARERDVMIHTVANDVSEILRVSVTDEPELNKRIKTYFANFNKIIQQSAETEQKYVVLRERAINRLDISFDANMLRYVLDHPDSKERIKTLLAKLDRMESIYYGFMNSYYRTLPKMILIMLVLFSLLIGLLMGFIGKFYQNHIHLTTTTFFIISVIILNIIHDLDSPSTGFIKPNFQDITDAMEIYQIR